MITCERDGDCTVVELSGRLDGHTVASLEGDLLAELTPGLRLMVLDLERLQYVSSAGLRLILMLAKRVKRAGGHLRLCSPQPSVREVFEISGLISILPLHETRASALAVDEVAPGWIPARSATWS